MGVDSEKGAKRKWMFQKERENVGLGVMVKELL